MVIRLVAPLSNNTILEFKTSCTGGVLTALRMTQDADSVSGVKYDRSDDFQFAPRDFGGWHGITYAVGKWGEHFHLWTFVIPGATIPLDADDNVLDYKSDGDECPEITIHAIKKAPRCLFSD